MLDTVHIVIVHPDNIMRIGISSLIKEHPDLVVDGETSDYLKLPWICSQLRPNLLLLGINGSFHHLLPQVVAIQHEQPQMSTLILSPSHDETCLLHFARIGVAGYFVTTSPAEALISAIHTITLGSTWFSASLIESLLLGQNKPTKSSSHQILQNLTVREQQILQLVAQGWTNQHISKTLHVAERTVRFHVRSIYDKLHFTTRSEVVAWAIKSGIDA